MNRLDENNPVTRSKDISGERKPWVVPQIENIGDLVRETKGTGGGTTDVLIGGGGGFEFGGGMS
jgi:hypothetical protein